MPRSSARATSVLAIEIQDLHKTFGPVRALEGLHLTVDNGEVAGFLGPNGAGKSTTIRVLLGLLRADSGHVRLFGRDPWTDAVVAYVPGEVSLWPNLTGGEVIDFLARLRGRPDKRRKAELLERFELDPTKKARTYSKGNRQKIALIAAFSAAADLLVLDEPTSGLDPLMEAVFTECLREAKTSGASVLLSSHILHEVEKVCDTVTIIRAGRAVESGTLADLRHLTRTSVVAILATDPQSVAALPGVHNLAAEQTSDGIHVSFDVDHDAVGDILPVLSSLGVRSFTAAPPSLEELFMRHYGDQVPVQSAAGAR